MFAFLVYIFTVNLTDVFFPVGEYRQGFLPIFHWLAVAISIYYFGIKGLVHVQTAHENLVEIMERRIRWTLKEGWNWILPYPFMSSIPTDTRQHPLDPHFEEVLTKDEIAMEIDAFALVKVVDVYKFHDVDTPFISFAKFFERTVRILVSKEWAMDTEVEKDGVKKVVTGVTKAAEPLSEALDLALKENMSQWGLGLDEAMIKRVQLPDEIEKATAQKRVEQHEREAKDEEVRGVRDRMRVFDRSGLTAKEKLNAVQAEDGKATRVIIDGNASTLEKAGALAGGVASGKGE